jgi:hypothetical protein
MVKQLYQNRATRLLDELSDKKPIRDADGQLHPKMIEWCNRLYDDFFSSVAFQAALICGYSGLVEQACRGLDKGDFPDAPQFDHDEAFNEYIDQINQFFAPKTIARLKKLIQVVTGEVLDDKELWVTTQSNQTFRSVVFRAEMQPDQWPKYRYLLLEIYNPSHPALSSIVAEERSECRKEVFSSLHDHHQAAFCRENQILEADLTKAQRTEIFNMAFKPYNALVRNIGAKALDRETMQVASSMVPAATVADHDASEPEAA